MLPTVDEFETNLPALLARHAVGSAGEPVRIEQINIIPLKGYSGKAVDRIDLTLATPNRSGITASFVRKACLAVEIRALEFLATVLGATALPEVIVSWPSAERPFDQEAKGFASPFYPGGKLTFDDPIPDAVLVTLARVHAECCHTEALGWTWTFDAAHFERRHAYALAVLSASEHFKATTADHAEWLNRLERVGRSDRLRDAGYELPKSLVHGDMHPENIVLRADGSPVIIDWGNACVAPPMLDLANIISIDSTGWHTYLSAYRKAGGTIDEPTCRRAYWWARAATGLFYLPWIAEHKPDATRMIVQIEDANDHLLDSR